MAIKWWTSRALDGTSDSVSLLAGTALARNPYERLAAKIEALRALIPILSTKGAPAVLLTMDDCWHPDSAVGRHYRLWRRLEKGGLQLPVSQRAVEFCARDHGMIRWWGWRILEYANLDPALIASFMEQVTRAYLVVGAAELEVAPLELNHSIDFDMHKAFGWAARTGVLVGRVFGEFDDLENGFWIGGEAGAVAELALQMGACPEAESL